MLKNSSKLLFLLVFTVIACTQQTPNKNAQKSAELLKIDSSKLAAEKPLPIKPTIQYHFEYKKIWSKKDSFEGYAHQKILAAINRVDMAHLKRLDSFLVPDKYTDTLSAYFPFPLQSPVLRDVRKIILFSYAAQCFAAYENGNLILTGPTNMGKKATKTPLGLFFCNWKSKETRSTVDNDWVLKWNFNVSNQGGVGFHQYDLPGYPASHSCMRLWAEQAEFLYSWAEQWKLGATQQLLAKGTPVIIYGEYPFGKPRPWFVLAQDAKALDISEENLVEILKAHKSNILAEQQKRDSVINAASSPALAVSQ